jgi:hypothetical protein
VTVLAAEREVRTDELAASNVGDRGPASAEVNRRIAAGRGAGIDFWSGRIGRPLTESEEDAIVVLADGLARAGGTP